MPAGAFTDSVAQSVAPGGKALGCPSRVTIRLVVWDKDPESGTRSIRDIKQQEVYFGEIPMLTEHGTFTVNGKDLYELISKMPEGIVEISENNDLQIVITNEKKTSKYKLLGLSINFSFF